MKMKLMAAALASLMIAAPALAQQGPQTPEERAARFDALDTNKDGKVTKAEWEAGLPDMMKSQATPEQIGQMWSTRFDADGDGSITKEQFVALPPPRRPG
jgi:Ca2+-binding EF-hand superfamily protein